jgi:hypothetical protein
MGRGVKWLVAVGAGGLAAALGIAGLWGDKGGGEAAARARTVSAAARAFDSGRAFADLRRQVEIGPRESGSPGGRQEVALIKQRLADAGLGGVKVQAKWRNVVVRLPGRKSGTIVVGAHHDTKDGIPGFVGANDGASGVAVLLEMARVLPRRLPGPSVTLVFFDAEEARGSRSFQSDGTRGSRQFVRYARDGGRRGSPRLQSIRAMFLLDMVGDCDLRIPYEGNSSRSLYDRLRGDAFRGRTGGILDDHIPFRKAGVPAVDAIDLSYGPGGTPGAWWHTPEDDMDKVCPRSLARAGRGVIRALDTF